MSHSPFEGLLDDPDALTDAAWDRIYPDKIQQLSEIHWTSLELVRGILGELKPGPDDRLLDFGSGVGKFCMLASLFSGCRVTGVERREHLHRIARWVARNVPLPRPVELICADGFDLDWSPYSIIYFYNPFQEYLHGLDAPTIDVVVPSDQAYDALVSKTAERLATLRPGTRIVTLHGWGGEFPPGYDQLQVGLGAPSVEIWRRV